MAGTSFDLVFTGGTVVDGTGAARYSADVGVSGDRITAIGDLSDSAAGRRVDASNRVIAPGFIDVHTHDDRALLANPTMDMKASQGYQRGRRQLRRQSRSADDRQSAAAPGSDLRREDPLSHIRRLHW